MLRQTKQQPNDANWMYRGDRELDIIPASATIFVGLSALQAGQ